MQIGSWTLKAFLRKAWSDCQQTTPNASLRPLLVQYSVNSVLPLMSGAIKSTTANGQHTILETDPAKTPITAEDAMRIWTYLTDEYDRAAGELGFVSPVNQTFDAQVEAQMEANLRPILPGNDLWMYLMK